MYGGYIILWWFLGGLIFYCLLNLITQSPKEEADLLYPYSSYMLSGILVSWMHSRTYYAVRKEILQIRTSTRSSEDAGLTRYHTSSTL